MEEPGAECARIVIFQKTNKIFELIARCYKTQHWESPPPVWATVGYVSDDDDDGDDDDDDDEDDEQELSDMWELCNESGHSCYCCHTVIIIFQRAQRNPLFCPLSINPT